MKLINRLFATLIFVATLTMAGCEKPAPIPTEKPIPVTYAALDGCWQLTMWQGASIAEDTYLYIEFDRATHTYAMWDNIDSMYAVENTGSFTITTEEDGRYTLSGYYDYGKGDWSSDYYIELFNQGNRMQWRGVGATMDFERISEIPELY